MFDFTEEKKETSFCFWFFAWRGNWGQPFFADESLNQLYQAIRQLSEVDRAVIMFYLEEKSYQEIAEIIGTNQNNIKVH
jgi:RNA polymerase sigma-70 factor (ECF subfamily)